ncbi:MAG: hypothetical protein JWN98_1171 [Abditibacteriota bacterium]|nr:hypothetical protein [Abditibacteriota bacterium]
MKPLALSHPRSLSSRWMRPTAFVLLGTMSAPLLSGCAGQPAQAPNSSPPPPPGFSQNSQPANGQRASGMSTRNKVVLLAGAAALYYLYNKRKQAQAQGPNGRYFVSKSNGRVYYRDLKTRRFQYVSPPQQPLQVPASEAAAYQGYQGFNNAQNGRAFGGYGNGQNSYEDAIPAQF